MKILCPFHEESTPSCEVYHNGYCCFGCGASGPLSNLPKEYQTNPELAKPRYIENVESTIRWIKSLPTREIRGLNLFSTDVSYFIIWPDNRYYIRRYFDASQQRGKYHSPSGHSRPLFVANRHNSNKLIVVEGEINAMSIASCGVPATVVSPGSANSFYSKEADKHLIYYRKFDKIYLIVDADKAGAKAGIELKSKLLLNKIDAKIILYPVGEDANDVLVKYGKEELKRKICSQLGMPEGVYSD